MTLTLPNLPFKTNALEPYISQKTVEFHYNKHHAGYVKKANALIKGTKFENLSLIEIIKESQNSPEHSAIFNNVAQIYNHNLFWTSIKPSGGEKPNQKTMQLINSSFESFEDFIQKFKNLAISRFGSGWGWLSFDKQAKNLILSSTSNAENPLTKNLIPLITIDVWEHAYYLDYQNERPKFVDVFFDKLVNWNNAEIALKSINI